MVGRILRQVKLNAMTDDTPNIGYGRTEGSFSVNHEWRIQTITSKKDGNTVESSGDYNGLSMNGAENISKAKAWANLNASIAWNGSHVPLCIWIQDPWN